MASSVNVVKYYFYKNMMPDDPTILYQYITLAYQTARDRAIYPTAVLIRSRPHDTTRINGTWQKDPGGTHVTLSYKTTDQTSIESHVTSHAYVDGSETLRLVRATHAGEKLDSTERQRGKAVWPDADELEEAPNVGYGHFS